MKCKTYKCRNTWTKNSSNPTKELCADCFERKKKLLRINVDTFKRRFKELGQKERKALYHILITMSMDNPTLNQIKDISYWYMADYKIVKDNLDLGKLTKEKKYYKFQ